MRIIVFSDSHGNPFPLLKIMEAHKDAGTFIFLGDGEGDFKKIHDRYPDRPLLGVRGNCDWGSELPLSNLVVFQRKRIFYTHGHRFQVKQGLESLEAEARGLGADVVLFGHTHTSLSDYRDGVHFLNPGSVSHPRNGQASYGVVDLTPEGIVARVVAL